MLHDIWFGLNDLDVLMFFNINSEVKFVFVCLVMLNVSLQLFNSSTVMKLIFHLPSNLNQHHKLATHH